jgi:hypothetical protein
LDNLIIAFGRKAIMSELTERAAEAFLEDEGWRFRDDGLIYPPVDIHISDKIVECLSFIFLRRIAWKE